MNRDRTAFGLTVLLLVVACAEADLAPGNEPTAPSSSPSESSGDDVSSEPNGASEDADSGGHDDDDDEDDDDDDDAHDDDDDDGDDDGDDDDGDGDDAAPEWASVDVNPTSPTYDQMISTRDTLGSPSLWIGVFDSDC